MTDPTETHTMATTTTTRSREKISNTEQGIVSSYEMASEKKKPKDRVKVNTNKKSRTAGKNTLDTHNKKSSQIACTVKG